MRDRIYRQPDPPQSIDLTPMLDVVFIMLIFFIVTATFIREPGIDVDRAVAVTGAGQTPAILVAVGQDDSIWIDQQKVESGNLRLHILRLRTENPHGGLVIQADGRAAMATLSQVADAARSAGIDNVSVSTRSP